MKSFPKTPVLKNILYITVSHPVALILEQHFNWVRLFSATVFLAGTVPSKSILVLRVDGKLYFIHLMFNLISYGVIIWIH